MDTIFVVSSVDVTDFNASRAKGWYRSLEDAVDDLIGDMVVDSDRGINHKYLVIEEIAHGLPVATQAWWFQVDIDENDEDNDGIITPIDRPAGFPAAFCYGMG